MKISQLATIFALTLTPLASATDVWVDNVSGSNTNTGVSPLDAFETITFALQQLGPSAGAGVDRVFILPGLYTASTGESFPMTLRNRVRLVGVGQRETIDLRGRIILGDSEPTDWETGLENLRLASGPGNALGVFMPSPDSGWRRGTLERVLFRNHNVSVRLIAQGATAIGSGLRIKDSLFEGCTRSLRARVTDGATAVIKLDGLNVGSGTNSFRLFCGDGSAMRTLVTRSRIVAPAGNTSPQSLQSQAALAHLDMQDSLLALGPSLSAISINGTVNLDRCTLTSSQGSVYFLGPTHIQESVIGPFASLLIEGIGPVRLERSLTSNTSFAGMNGNVIGEAQFRNRESNDFRLAFGSPGIDTLPASSIADLDGLPRNLDGDLDTVCLADMGAFESATLAGPRDVLVGTTELLFEVQGEPGQPFRLFAAHGDLTNATQTPFGRSYLSPGFLRFVGVDVTDLGPLRFNVPLSPNVLTGTRISFQALQQSSSAPLGVATSSPVAIRIR